MAKWSAERKHAARMKSELAYHLATLHRWLPFAVKPDGHPDYVKLAIENARGAAHCAFDLRPDLRP